MRSSLVAQSVRSSATPEQIGIIGLESAYCINKEEHPLAEMLADTAVNLERAAAQLMV